MILDKYALEAMINPRFTLKYLLNTGGQLSRPQYSVYNLLTAFFHFKKVSQLIFGRKFSGKKLSLIVF